MCFIYRACHIAFVERVYLEYMCPTSDVPQQLIFLSGSKLLAIQHPSHAFAFLYSIDDPLKRLRFDGNARVASELETLAWADNAEGGGRGLGGCVGFWLGARDEIFCAGKATC